MRETLSLFNSTMLATAGAGAAAIWMFQAYLFARSGQWASISAADLLLWLTEHEWFEDPDNWLGVHMILDWLNAGSALLAGMTAMLLALVWVLDTAGLLPE